MLVIDGSEHHYHVGDQVAETEYYRLYLCKQEGTNRPCLLQIATEKIHNGVLEKGAFWLTELEKEAARIEEAFAKVREKDTQFMNYQYGFPELVDSFVCDDQGGRLINILAFRHVEDLSEVVPVINITAKDRRRVDQQTSAWIMGKSLKLLTFAHSLGVSIRNLDGNNILIDPAQHYVIFFDWSQAVFHEAGMPSDIARAEISQAAQTVITALGSDWQSGKFPDKTEEQYNQFLLNLAGGHYRQAETAHREFYQLIDGLWPTMFYPFTSYPL